MINGHEIKKRISDLFGCLALRGLYLFVPRLPLKVSYSLAEKIGLFACTILFPYRRRVIKNLRVAFGKEKSEEELAAICKRMSVHMVKGSVELLYSCSPAMEKIFERIRIEGKENLDEALNHGRGVVAVSSHLGNFTLLGRKLEREGYPFHTARKDPKGPRLTRFYRQLEKTYGGRFIYVDPWRESLRCMMSAIRKNEVVCLVADENKRHGGVKVDFFDQRAATAIGPAILALRTGAPIVPIFILREPDDTHTIIIEPQMDCELSGDQDKDVYLIAETFTRIIEGYVKRYPDQWQWISNRWKEKPPRKQVRIKRRDLVVQEMGEEKRKED